LKIGFLINPIAGLGGKVGLKGTDNASREAFAMGATPIASVRAVQFLKRLKELELTRKINLITCPSVMGYDAVKSAGLTAEILPLSIGSETSAEDTKLAVRLMMEKDVDFLVFVGGDGTARDIFDALNGKVTAVLGVPSGVKMYSGIFAASVKEAADLLQASINGEAQIIDFEIVDANEEAIRSDKFSTRLYGFLKGPYMPARILGSKEISPETLDELENQRAIAKFVVEEMKLGGTYILGPGTTIKCVADLLGIEKTLLGVDIYRGGKVIKDVNEDKILGTITDWNNTWLIVSPIGRQGMLLGRGNQQISPEILREIGKEHVIVAATRGKIQGIEGTILRVDTGDSKVDEMLRGYIKVVTEYREWRLMQII